MGRGGRACRRGFPVSTGGVFFPSSLKGEQKVHTLLRLVAGCHIRAVTWSHSQHVRRSQGSSLYYSDIKLKKKKKMTNKNETEESRQQVAAFRPGSCMCPSPRPLAPDTPSLSGYQCISVHKRETKSQTDNTITVRLTSCLWGLILKQLTNRCICVGLLSAAD